MKNYRIERTYTNSVYGWEDKYEIPCFLANDRKERDYSTFNL